MAMCLMYGLVRIYFQVPGTPEHLKKYRKSHNNQPGLKQVHYGMAQDNNRSESFLYGKKTYVGEHVDQVIQAQNLEGLAEYYNDVKESKYASHVREPLAKSFVRGHQLPEKTKEEKFQFGVPTIGSESAKDVLYPFGREKEEKPEHQSQYNKTHGAFGPGEQKQRDYNWPVDNNQHRFGFSEGRVPGGADNSLRPELYPKTKIVQKTVEDQKAVAHDILGQSKNLGQGHLPIDNSTSFGVKTMGNDKWNAAQCLSGDPTDREVQPDEDLGKCTKSGCRNEVRCEADNERVFGAPSIRLDIPYKEKKSVADHQNYGDEPDAVELLFPNTFTELGITETDFAKLRTRGEVKQLFEAIGYQYMVGKFNAIYNRARHYCESPDDRCSVRAFMQAVKELDPIE